MLSEGHSPAFFVTDPPRVPVANRLATAVSGFESRSFPGWRSCVGLGQRPPIYDYGNNIGSTSGVMGTRLQERSKQVLEVLEPAVGLSNQFPFPSNLPSGVSHQMAMVVFWVHHIHKPDNYTFGNKPTFLEGTVGRQSEKQFSNLLDQLRTGVSEWKLVGALDAVTGTHGRGPGMSGSGRG